MEFLVCYCCFSWLVCLRDDSDWSVRDDSGLFERRFSRCSKDTAQLSKETICRLFLHSNLDHMVAKSKECKKIPEKHGTWTAPSFIRNCNILDKNVDQIGGWLPSCWAEAAFVRLSVGCNQVPRVYNAPNCVTSPKLSWTKGQHMYWGEVVQLEIFRFRWYLKLSF